MRHAVTAVVAGTSASAAVLAAYAGILTLASGWSFTLHQLAEYWPFVVALALGFGLQVTLYLHLRDLSELHHHAGHVMAASGSVTGAAMLACCTHYLVNILPILGAVGVMTLVASYQRELFWMGLLFNTAGVGFIGSRIWKAKREIGGHS